MTLPNSSSINNYGSGVLVDAVPLVDPTSEMGAAALNPLRNDVAAMTATAARCVFQFTAIGGTGSVNILSSPTWTAGNDSNWGNSNAVRPVITKLGTTGDYSVQLPSTVSDQIGNTNLVNIRFAIIQPIGIQGIVPTTSDSGICVVSSSSTFYMRLFRSGSANDCAGSHFVVLVF